MKVNGVKIGLLFLLFFSGFGRDYIMVNINWIIKHLTLGAPNYAQNFFSPLLNWELTNLQLLKWGLTIVFTFYFFVLTFNLVKLIFPNDKQFLNYTKYTFILIVGVSGVLYGASYVFKLTNTIYPAIRTLMGLVQSFIPFMVLYLLFKFIPQTHKKSKS